MHNPYLMEGGSMQDKTGDIFQHNFIFYSYLLFILGGKKNMIKNIKKL